eukprot:430664-Hanusia_phi.AAC.1
MHERDLDEVAVCPMEENVVSQAVRPPRARQLPAAPRSDDADWLVVLLLPRIPGSPWFDYTLLLRQIHQPRLQSLATP